MGDVNETIKTRSLFVQDFMISYIGRAEFCSLSGIMIGMGSVTETRRYNNVILYFIVWAHTENNPWLWETEWVQRVS